MSVYIHKRVKLLIDETSDSFSSKGRMNLDYAEFATGALNDFKDALHKKELTRVELINILRNGMNKHKMRQSTECWSSFMAKHIVRAANVRKTDNHLCSV